MDLLAQEVHHRARTNETAPQEHQKGPGNHGEEVQDT